MEGDVEVRLVGQEPEPEMQVLARVVLGHHGGQEPAQPDHAGQQYPLADIGAS